MTTEQASAQAYKADARNDNVLVYVNGSFVPRNEARVSVFDSGFVLGDGVWEGLRSSTSGCRATAWSRPCRTRSIATA
jgi:branched-chain amino acid aminotransferase